MLVKDQNDIASLKPSSSKVLEDNNESSTASEDIKMVVAECEFNGEKGTTTQDSGEQYKFDSNSKYSGEIKGPEGQVCESKSVLDAILTKYVHINTNTSKGGATGKIKAEYMICDCRYNHLTDEPYLACGINSNCINRELSIECPEDGCPCGPFCQNRKFSLRQYAPVQVFDTHTKGFGLRTKMALPKSSFVMEYCGEVLPTTIFKKRIIEYAKAGAKHFYFMSLKANEFIDASKKGNISRFMNHSCSPNCELQKWVVGNQMRIGIFTIKDVAEGDELTFDYKFERYGNEAQPCYCGESVCTGFIGKEQSESSTMQIASDEEISEEEDNEEEEGLSGEIGHSQSQQGKALQSFEQVKDIVKYLMMYAGNPSKVLRAINKLLKTETVALQRKFIHFRGLYLLERCLELHISSKSIIKHNILLVLQMLPISTKNGVVKLEPMVQKMTDSEAFGYATAELAKKILENWVTLEMVYKIPKRSKSEASETSGSLDLKRTRSAEESVDSRESDEFSNKKVARSVTPERTPSFSSSYYDRPTPTSVVYKEISRPQPELSWNNVVAIQEKPLCEDPKSANSVDTPTALEGISESSIEQMIEAAQEAKRLKMESEKKRQQEELEEQKKISKLKKKKMQERKEKQRELSQALGKKLVEKAIAAQQLEDAKSSKEESSKSKSAKRESLDGKFDISDKDRSLIKKSLSDAVIKTMSRYKDQMTSDIFKERAKAITKGLVEKELRKYSDNDKKSVPSELSEASIKAVKKYVKEYLSRHDIKVE